MNELYASEAVLVSRSKYAASSVISNVGSYTE